MNKYKKLAIAAVSVVMAGTMVASLAACNGGGGNKGGGTLTQAKLQYTTDNAGKLSYAATTTLKLDIGDAANKAIGFGNNSGLLSGNRKLCDGNTYSATDLKPAWKALQTELGLVLQDNFSIGSNKITKNYESQASGLAGTDILTDTAATIVSKANENVNTFLDLNQYLDVMPNYKKFLEDRPLVYMSLTSNTDNGAMYYAPYFDGNDDIEKYVLTKTNWVVALLDAEDGSITDTTTWKAQIAGKSLGSGANGAWDDTKDKAQAESFMGKTGSYTVGTTNKANQTSTTLKTLTVDYAAAITDLGNDTDGSLKKLVEAVSGVTTVKTDSGNIVDIMNQMINDSKGAVTGAQLLKVLQRYIDVVYKDGSGKFYTKRSDVFNAVDAGWDVDLLTALARCLVTNPSLIKSGSAGNTIGGSGATALKDLYAIASRTNDMQRQSDMYSFAGELYGARGLESRYEFSYIGQDGKLYDARQNEYTYTALDKFSKLVKEGLACVTDNSAGNVSYYKSGKIEAMMNHDYLNTQTPAGFQKMQDTEVKAGNLASGYDIEADYNFTPILTPVSKWDVNGDGTNETVMRFTESWRSVKDSGFAIPYASVQDNPDKLSALLKLIDYMFSHDGQIAMTYGPMASDVNGTGGFWYNTEATAEQVTAGTYFEYKGKKYYSDLYYAGEYQPKLTIDTRKAYQGVTVNDVDYNTAWGEKNSCVRNYTNFARFVIGSALNVGNKLQSFEYQATCDMGKEGGARVDVNLKNGAIKHVTQTVDKNNYWYTIVPTTVPLTPVEAKYINENVTDLKNTLFSAAKTDKTNYFFSILAHGLGNSDKVGGESIGATPKACIETLESKYHLATYVGYKQNGWNKLKAYYEDVVAPKLEG